MNTMKSGEVKGISDTYFRRIELKISACSYKRAAEIPVRLSLTRVDYIRINLKSGRVSRWVIHGNVDRVALMLPDKFVGNFLSRLP